MTTGSTPFMMPLLCVAARYGSACGEGPRGDDAVAHALAGEFPEGQVHAPGSVQRARARRRSARLDRMRRCTLPPVSSSMVGASASHAVLTAFAPIASRVS